MYGKAPISRWIDLEDPYNITNLSSYSTTVASAFKSCFRASEPRAPLRLRAIFRASSRASFALDRRIENTASGIAKGEEDSWAFKRTGMKTDEIK